MPEYLHKPTLTLLYSESYAPDQSGDYVEISRADFHAWNAIVPKYRKLAGDTIVEMDASEKAAADATEQTAQRDALVAQLAQAEDILRAFMLVVLDELNLHADKHNAVLDAADNAVSLADFKARMALIADYPQRTEQQLRTAVRGKLGN